MPSASDTAYMSIHYLVASLVWFGAGLLMPHPLEGVEAADRAIKRSDVVFMGNYNPEIMGDNGPEITKLYGGTVVNWGGRPWDTEAAVQERIERIKVFHDLGVRFLGGAEFRASFRHMIDFDPNFMDSVCRRLDGEPILVPWFWDHQHKDGHPAYWFCTNAPGYRKYLKHQIQLAVGTDVDGLHIDDFEGTGGTEWHGGCFCKHCMAGFRDYLKKHVPPAKLEAHGVESLDNFDYGRFLRDKGVTVDQYRGQVRSTLPLGPGFLTFLYRSATAWVGESCRYAESLVGHPLMLSVNSTGLLAPPQLTFFSGEVSHGAPEGGMVRPYPIWNFKLADALGKAQVCTGVGQDWAYIDEHKKPGLVRTWIAQAYAFGHQFMSPVHQWCYTQEKGTHWYQSQPADYAHLYRFVRRNADLFDGYQAAASVALLYSNPAMERNKQACYWLAEHNVPFRMVIAGDEWLDARLTDETLSHYAALVAPEPTGLGGEQKQALEAFAREGKVIKWDAGNKVIDTQALSRLVPRQIAITGAQHVMAVPRAIPGKPGEPVVVHLLNRNYDPAKDAVATQTNVTLEIDRSLFGTADFSKATLYAPPETFDPKAPGASEPVGLEAQSEGETLSVRIPSLGLWGLVKLER